MRLAPIALILLLSTMATFASAMEPLVNRRFIVHQLPAINQNQTANIQVVFLGISQDYVDEGTFEASISKIAKRQFSHPNTITWNLNVSIQFCEFPKDIPNSLAQNAFHLEGISYYNITLLDTLLAQQQDIAIPDGGCLVVFMWIPDNGTDHSWFFVHGRLDLWLGTTEYLDNVPYRYWAFPPSFGGIHRAIYFDLSDIMENTPTIMQVATHAISRFSNGLNDIFMRSVGFLDQKYVAAETQRYENYEVKVLWLNATGEQLYFENMSCPEQIRESFEDLMPWTMWNITIQAKSMHSELSELIKNRTKESSQPFNDTLLLPDGKCLTIEAQRAMTWQVFGASLESDPVNRYLFDHVKDYFNLTDLTDKSVICVAILQLRNDTAVSVGGQRGSAGGVACFHHNVIIFPLQGGSVVGFKENGFAFLTRHLIHEIGHWVGLFHHSSSISPSSTRVSCSMCSQTNTFCAFCKDARARMSFMSYYKATIQLLANSTGKAENIKDDLGKALQLFYNWQYAEAVDAVASVYHRVKDPPSMGFNPIWVLLGTVTTISAIGLAFVLCRLHTWIAEGDRELKKGGH